VTAQNFQDPEFALERAVELFKGNRFDTVACSVGHEAATRQVLETADMLVAWLRRITSLTLTLTAVREQDSGDEVPITRGGDMSVQLDTSQEAVFDINSQDDRGFLTKAALDLTVTGDNITAQIVETPDANTPNQLVVTAVQPGAGGLVVLSVPDNDTIADASESFDVVPGGVAVVALGAPTIREQGEGGGEPAPEPV
jgi:hypothetical protein